MEKKMTVIITMAGLGSRFRKIGYAVPKYMINAKGRTLFDWAMDSLVDTIKMLISIFLLFVRKTTLQLL